MGSDDNAGRYGVGTRAGGADHLSAVVHPGNCAHGIAGEGTKFADSTGWSPDDAKEVVKHRGGAVRVTGSRLCSPGDGAKSVDCTGVAVGSTEGRELGHASVSPEERNTAESGGVLAEILRVAVGGFGLTGDDSGSIQAVGEAIGTAEAARGEVNGLSELPEDGMLGSARNVRDSGDESVFGVALARLTEGSAGEGTEIGDGVAGDRAVHDEGVGHAVGGVAADEIADRVDGIDASGSGVGDVESGVFASTVDEAVGNSGGIAIAADHIATAADPVDSGERRAREVDGRVCTVTAHEAVRDSGDGVVGYEVACVVDAVAEGGGGVGVVVFADHVPFDDGGPRHAVIDSEVVSADDLSAVVDGSKGGDGGAGDVDGDVASLGVYEAVHGAVEGVVADDIALGVDAVGIGVGSAGEVDGGEASSTPEKAVVGLVRQRIEPDDVASIVDAPGEGCGGAGEVEGSICGCLGGRGDCQREHASEV